jgi:GntR family transcriptional regulator / MocR family aminotransferase
MYHLGMGKRAASFDLVVHTPPAGMVLFQWLCDEIKAAILEGRLRRGVRLPSTRELARLYGVSRGTVVAAFEQLHSEGYLQAKTGAGTHVNTRFPEDLLHAKPSTAPKPRKAVRAPVLSRYAQRLMEAPPCRPALARAFRAAEPALDTFPMNLWAQIASRRLRRATRTLLANVDPRGYWPLRQAVAEYLGSARGVKCSTEQVIISSGIQHGLDLTARLVLDADDPVWVEDPCFFLVPKMFETLGARVVPVPVDGCGLNVDEGRRRCDRAKLAYVTPAHQFPLGLTMTVERRLKLLAWARRTRGLVFEDDYDSEYRYSGHPIPALQGLDQQDSVVLAGSFSKLLFSSLRLGYLVVPQGLVDKFAAARFIMDRHSSVFDQAIMCDFITEGHFGRHIRRMRELYANRLGVLRESVQQKLSGLLEVPEIEAGVHTVGWLSKGFNAEAVARSAAERKVEVIPINRFALKVRMPDGLLLGFGAVDDAEIRRGVDELAACLEEIAQRKHHLAAGARALPNA